MQHLHALSNAIRHEHSPLSVFERRCLLKHICDCHELLQLTLLGAAGARDKAGDVEELVRIQRNLRVAELRVARAEQLAVALLRGRVGDGDAIASAGC